MQICDSCGFDHGKVTEKTAESCQEKEILKADKKG